MRNEEVFGEYFEQKSEFRGNIFFLFVYLIKKIWRVVLRVYLKGDHNFPKRIDGNILAYYANNNIVIMRKSVKRAILPQNINIKNNQPYLCALWSEMSLGIKAVFTDYAKAYKIDTRQKRTQGVSSFSMFIYFLYRLQKRYQVQIKDMTVSFIMDIFSQFNTIKKLMKNSLLYSLNRRFSLQNSKLVKKAKQPELPQKANINELGKEKDTNACVSDKTTFLDNDDGGIP
jgi:hypothetical protein